MAGKVVLTSAVVHDDDGEVVIRGLIHPKSLRNLQRPGYQREVLSDAKIAQLMQGHRDGRVPDVDLNMRSHRYTPYDDGTVELLDDVFMVDGLQRVTAGKQVMDDTEHPFTPVIGAYVTIGKDEEWERKRFKVLNSDRTKLSPNVHLKNETATLPALAALFRLTSHTEFPLRGKIQWGQASKPNEFLTATVYVKTVGRLHGHLGPGRASNVFDIARGIDQITDVIGVQALRHNVMEFFELLDVAWKISTADSKTSTLFKSSFLFALADVLSAHQEFWSEDGHRLSVPASNAQKLRGLKVDDRSVQQYASGGAGSISVLSGMLLQRLNLHRRTKLTEWSEEEADGEDGD